jgi:hypothetical protein
MVPARALILLLLLASSAARAGGSITWGEVPKTKEEYITIEEATPEPPQPQPHLYYQPERQPQAPAPAAQESLRPLDVEPPMPKSPDDGALSDVADLLKHQRQAQAVYGGLNSTNPLSDQFDIEAMKEKIAHTLGLNKATLERVAGTRKLAALSQYAGNPSVTTDWRRIVESPIRSLWIWVQVGWIFVFFLLRAWRLAFAEGFFHRMFERMWLYVVFFAGTFVVIPWTLFGSPYYRVVTGAVSILFS